MPAVFSAPFAKPFESSEGGASASALREAEEKFVWNNQMRWACFGAIERLSGKRIDAAKSFSKGPNGGTYYPGMIVFTDGTSMDTP